MSRPRIAEQSGTELPDDYDVRPLGAFYGMLNGLYLTLLVGGLIACVAWAVTR